MNELVFVKENFNVIHASFIKKGFAQGKIYKWYLPYQDLDKIHIHTVATIQDETRKKKVFVEELSYHPKAKELYKQLPLTNSRSSWQIQLICQYLANNGIEYYRERAFRGLTTTHNKPLRIDVSFQIADQWYFIEYHGTHHYFKRGASTQRFKNILKNMELRRIWCKEHQVPYLEIPFFRQTEIKQLVEAFILENV
ncbi:hypothetical protein [Listeria costaricensis]|uniref:hypothetical protein n=1 Tax=Listeria costaricensis TaxID=2026604 RepID=UPI000C076FF4|nr:hypothetical protein [Listeria costaricensis]